MKQKVIIDTDIGDDIDDLIAIALGLKLENIEIIGITTVFCDTLARARIARRALTLAGRKDIPVYAGSRDGLNGKNDCPRLCQMTEDADLPEYDAINAKQAASDGGESAVDFILGNARKYKEELVILGIGPLTNLAKAFLKDPVAMNSVKKIVIMGGTFLEQHREWNILCDIEAAVILFERAEKLYCVGFDVTKKTTVPHIEHKEMMKKTGEPFRDYMADLVALWSERSWHAPTLHDPLAMYYISDPEVLQMKVAKVKIETKGEYTRGMSVNLDNYKEGCSYYCSTGKTHIAVAVDELKLREVVARTLFPGKIQEE